MRIPLSALAMLMLSLPPSVAFDGFVNTELEQLAGNAAMNAAAELHKRRVRVYDAVAEVCRKPGALDPARCQSGLLLLALDQTRTLFNRCKNLQDRHAVDECVIAGPEALTIVAALGGDPSQDIDWEHVGDSYVRLHKALQEAVRIRCGSEPVPFPSECMIEKQAELLGLPQFIGYRCTRGRRDTWQSCLDIYRSLAIYMQATNDLQDRFR